MDRFKRIWEAIVDFLQTYDSYKVMDIVKNLKWEDVAGNTYVWLVGLPTVGYLLYKKRIKTLILLSSMGGFLYLLKITIPSSGEEIPFDMLLTFIGGSVALAALNLYFLFMRGD